MEAAHRFYLLLTYERDTFGRKDRHVSELTDPWG
jgi:hypothetical protein